MELNFTTFTNIIDGKPTTTAETRYSINPSTKAPNPPVPVSTKQDLDDAVNAARRALKGWAATPWDERRDALLSFVKAVVGRKEEFAGMLVREQGKPYMFALLEVAGVERQIQGLATLKLEDEVVADEGGRKVVKRYVPLGVGGAIVPWNFPVMLMMLKISHAVLTGNTVVCKPSPFTPYTGLKLVELAQQFFPPGVVNVLSGDDNLGPWMTAHPGIDKISFTGSSVTGRKVMESCSRTLKRVTLELGGKDPAIILPDVDVPLVAAQIAFYSFFNSGQICMATKRIYVHSSIAKEFVSALVAAAKNFKVGDGMGEGVFMGPVNNGMQYEKVMGFMDDVKKTGGEVVLGGDPARFRYKAEEKGGQSGYFIDPTIVFNPSEESRIMKEEPFGPIVPVVKWDDEEDVIRRANDTDMGLGASVWGKDVERAESIARRLEAGSVWLNEHIFGVATAPFGGWKGSGVGVENGREGLVGWCNVQSLYIKGEVKSVL
ncbi:uncharacterized protein DFL_000431 [Arthrobotrys flagrans]|uniref:aldehyde dehydrogenase (NAD(+)) n=1 Tax=Arthrobotrys flagrans TaxID=97331 RepID=A0A437AE94_ARTFL|nr:hypothetical protein DFL_000431 [Arthrobotrys flagrans]